MVDAQGRPATYTGSGCFQWAGGLTGEGYAIQGNILTGPDVVQAMEAAYLESGRSLPRRLYRALLAGDQAGGDRRGRQSAAIIVVKPQGGYGGFNDVWVDYRVDDHPDPVGRLGDLLDLHDLYFGSSPVEDQVALDGDPCKRLQEIMSRLQYYQGDATGVYDAETRKALGAFIGSENFEDRTYLDSGRMDRPVYEYLIRKFGEKP
jgi:uncharacterized Ntn-hydrolase superfamily protein